MTKNRVKEKNKLQLAPQDYIVFYGGLKIENVSKDNYIEVNFPKKYTITPIIFKNKKICKENH